MKLKNKFSVRCSSIADILTDAKMDNYYGLSKMAFNEMVAWIKSQPEFYNRLPISSRSMYTDKGIQCEPEGIVFAGSVLGWDNPVKNTTRIIEDFVQGECDVLLPLTVEDIKCSWDEKTFPLFDPVLPDSRYYAQMQGYMHLYNRNSSGVVYVLMNAPDSIVERMVRNHMYENGIEEMTEDLFMDFRDRMTFDKYPDGLRIRRFEVKRDYAFMARVFARAQQIRDVVELIELV